MRKRRILKTVSAIMVVVFSYTTGVFAAPSSYEITVSEDAGSVSQRYKGTSERLIIHIQDAHSNFEAQKNLANIICELIPQIRDNKISESSELSEEHKNHYPYLTHSTNSTQLPFIGVEGAIEKVSSEPFRAFPLSDIRQRIGEQFVHEGKFTGSELAAVEATDNFMLWGLEDPELFEKNFRAFYAVAQKQSELETELAKLEEIINYLKEMLFGESLKEFDDIAVQYERGEIEFKEYLEPLYKKIETLGIDLFDYPTLQQFKEIFVMQQSINFQSVDRDISQLADVMLTEDLCQRDKLCATVNRLYKDYCAGKVEQKDIATHMFALGTKMGFYAKNYPYIMRAMDFWRRYAMIDLSAMLREILVVNNDIRSQLASSEEEEVIINAWDKMMHLKRLLSLKALEKDVTVFREHKEEYSLNSIMENVRKVYSDYKLRIPYDEPSLEMEEIYAFVDEFYTLAEKRDHVLLSNLMKKMDTEGQDIGVLVAGGYHTEGITRELREQNISYVTITPQITQVAEDVAYMDRMMGNLAPLSPHLISHFQPRRFTAFQEAITNDAALLVRVNEFIERAGGEAAQRPEDAARLLLSWLNNPNPYKQALAEVVYEIALGKKSMNMRNISESLQYLQETTAAEVLRQRLPLSLIRFEDSVAKKIWDSSQSSMIDITWYADSWLKEYDKELPVPLVKIVPAAHMDTYGLDGAAYVFLNEENIPCVIIRENFAGDFELVNNSPEERKFLIREIVQTGKKIKQDIARHKLDQSLRIVFRLNPDLEQYIHEKNIVIVANPELEIEGRSWDGGIVKYKIVNSNLSWARVEINTDIEDALHHQQVVVHEILELQTIEDLIQRYPSVTVEGLNALVLLGYTDYLVLQKQISRYIQLGIEEEDLRDWMMLQNKMAVSAARNRSYIEFIQNGGDPEDYTGVIEQMRERPGDVKDKVVYSTPDLIARSSESLDVVVTDIRYQNNYAVVAGINCLDLFISEDIKGKLEALNIENVPVSTMEKQKQGYIDILAQALTDLWNVYHGLLGDFEHENGMIVIVEGDETDEPFRHLDDGIIVVPLGALEKAVTDKNHYYNLMEKLYHEFFHESAEAKGLIRNVMEAFYPALLETGDATAYTYVEELWLEYRTKLRLMRYGAVEDLTDEARTVGVSEPRTDVDVAMRVAIKRVYEQEKGILGQLSESTVRDQFAPINYESFRDQLLQAFAALERAEQELSRNGEWTREFDETLGNTVEDQRHAYHSIKRTLSDNPELVLRVGIMPEFYNSSLCQEFIVNHIVKLAQASGIRVEAVPYVPEDAESYHLLLEQERADAEIAFPPEIAGRVIVFSQDLNKAAVEIQSFSTVFVQLLDKVKELSEDGPLQAERLSGVLAQLFSATEAGYLRFRDIVINKLIEKAIVQETNERMLRIAA